MLSVHPLISGRSDQSQNHHLIMQANVLTGLVNLSIDTLFVSPFTALAILVGYAYILSIAAAVAHVCGIRLKFW